MGIMGIMPIAASSLPLFSIKAKHTTELPMATLPMAFSDRRQPTAVVGLSTVKLLYWTPRYAQKNIGATFKDSKMERLLGQVTKNSTRLSSNGRGGRCGVDVVWT